jgi:tetratricopeptide (TPR) repeat protein
VILLIFIFEPFRLETGPGEEASAQENSLAVMYFENMVDPEDTDRTAQMITALLITDLSESQYIRVVSRQRLYDILKLMGKEDSKIIDKTVASEVARRAGVRWILTGSILRNEPSIVLASDISDASTGDILAAQRITGDPGEDLFAVVDNLGAQVRKDLQLPEVAKRELDRPIADVTTHSVEAYRLYLEGIDYDNKSYHTEAERSFRQALKCDSTFAMAYYRLALLGWYQWSGQKERDLIENAMKYSDNVSWKEQRYIAGANAIMLEKYSQGISDLQKIIERYPDEKEALNWLAMLAWYLNRYEEAISLLTRVVHIDSMHVLSYEMLAEAYDASGDYEQALRAMNKAMSLAPDQPLTHVTKAELYSSQGEIDQAIGSYEASLRIDPEFSGALLGLGEIYLFKKQYARAESCYLKLCTHSEKYIRSWGRSNLALIPMYQGKFEEALAVLDDGIAGDRMEQSEGRHNAMKHLFRALIHVERGDLDLAAEQIEVSTENLRNAYLDDPIVRRDLYAYVLAKTGDTSGAEAVARRLKQQVDERDQVLMFVYWRALGLIALAMDNPVEAAGYLEKTLKGETASEFHVRLLLGRAYLESGRIGEAVEVLERALSRYDISRSLVPISAVKAYYLLGQAYELSGWNKKAIEQYEEFLEIWQNADPGIPEIEDARQRLAHLKKDT